MPVQVNGTVLSVRRVGAYTLLTLVAPGVAAEARPGQFVALSVGGPTSAHILRRAFSIHRVAERGVYGGTVEIVVSPHGPGTRWLAGLRQHDNVNVVGPMGRGFVLPKQAVNATLVGGGYGSAPLFMLAEQLRERGCRVDFVLGAATEGRLFGVLEAKRVSTVVTITTEDGSLGETGRVSDVLPGLLDKSESEVVYACGPMPMLQAVAQIADHYGAHSQCAVEESMACGVGVCMTCVLPVVGADGQTRMVRSCVEGPVFDGERVRWSEAGTVPADALGAGGGH